MAKRPENRMKPLPVKGQIPKPKGKTKPIYRGEVQKPIMTKPIYRGEPARPMPRPQPYYPGGNKKGLPEGFKEKYSDALARARRHVSNKAAVGEGYAGLGQQELAKRKQQHTALRDIALSKHTEAYKNMTTMKNLIGAHGSDPTFEKHLDSVYASADDSWVKQRAQLQKAAYWNKNLKKFGK
tara:strand:+ start:2272 stop:2817 length:546 start_codon:yes stop_codon:yes gene_type:complete